MRQVNVGLRKLSTNLPTHVTALDSVARPVLQQAGFAPQARIRVRIMTGCLVITTE